MGWLYAAIAGGAVLAGLSSGWVGRVRRQGVALVVAVIAWGLAVAAAGLAGSLRAMVLLLAVAGAADLVSAVYRQTILQTYAPDEMRGRMQGVFRVVVAGGPRLGDLRAGRPRPPSGSPPPGSVAACWPPPWSPWPCWCRPCATTTPATRFRPPSAIPCSRRVESRLR